MSSPTEFKDWVQFGVVIPVAYVWHLVVALRTDYNNFRSSVYSKDETDKMIQLTQKPLEQKLDMIQGDLHWIRKTLEERQRDE